MRLGTVRGMSLAARAIFLALPFALVACDESDPLVPDMAAASVAQAQAGDQAQKTGDRVEVEGVAELLEVLGDAPGRTLRVSLATAHGDRGLTILEGETAVDPTGDLVDFDQILGALLAGDASVRIEVDGTYAEDGSVGAILVKAEIDEDGAMDDDGPGDHDSVDNSGPGSHDDDSVDNSGPGSDGDDSVDNSGPGSHGDDDPATDDDGGQDDDGPMLEFEGVASLISIAGAAPERTLRLELTSEGTTSVMEIVEGTTSFDIEGDLLDIDAVLAALERDDLVVRAEGNGERNDEGVIIAMDVKVETDRVN